MSEPAPWSAILGRLLFALLGLVVILGLWQATQMRWPVKIVVSEGKVMSH